MVMHLAGPVLRRAAPKTALLPSGLVCLLALLFASHSLAADIADVRQQFINGQYQDCYRNCQKAIAEQEFGEEWRLLGIQALLEMGRYTNALELLTGSLDRYSASVQMRLLGHEVLLRNGDTERGPMLLQEINVLAGGRAWAYRGPTDLVALGRTALLLGAERKILDKVHSVNPWHPKAWAFRAVLSHLASDSSGETEAREKGLKFWKTNPEVDYLIGKKLSQKYRFAEGAAYQRRALGFNKQYVPAKIQLAQDLLRLGEETDGWKLADEVHRDDGYDITAYNLLGLHDNMEKFQTLTNGNFIVRMSAKESPIYGEKVLALLDRAKSNVCAKYGIELDKPTTVEIFPDQKDFGVRTFGMPGNPGYLGVCFGPVITANSPASQAGHPANWQAVLWHEFCHVVTLQMTKNKMPRWLSEGISVYEERQANPTWVQAMNPKYREMILGKDLTPVGKLSAAFLTPKTDMDLQFAYYESYLVVEFLV